MVLSLQSDSRKEVNDVEYILGVLMAVLAHVIGYYVCKWLDHHDSDN